MFSSLKLPRTRPTSAEEAVQRANEVFAQLGLSHATATLTAPPTGTDGFSGAEVALDIPEQDLKQWFANILAAKAEEQGGKVIDTQFALQSAPHHTVQIALSLTAKLMMASVPLRLEAELFVESDDLIGIRKIAFEAGAGMFAGMAAAMIRPKIAEIEGKTLNLSQITGMPLKVKNFTANPTISPKPGQSLQITLSA